MARIAFISHWGGRGGAERALLDIMVTAQQAGHEITCVIPRSGGMEEGLRAYAIPYRILHYNWWAGDDSIPLMVRVIRSVLQPFKAVRLAMHLRKFRPDLIYTNTVTICVGGLAAKLLKLPHIWHLHEYPWPRSLRFDFGKAFSMRCIDWLATHVVAVSHALSAEYSQFVEKPIRVFYQQVAVENDHEYDCRKGNQDDFVMGIVGNIMPAKGQLDALEALALLNDPSCKLRIIGSGHDEDVARVKSVVERLGLAAQVEFTGALPNATRAMAMLDAVLVCSLAEAFGRVTAEAMLLGKPIIGTDAGATPELLSHGVSGLLYHPGDVQRLAQHMRTLRCDPQVAHRLGAAAQRRAELLFSPEVYRQEVLSLLTDALFVAQQPV